jgi:hypothetical protein
MLAGKRRSCRRANALCPPEAAAAITAVRLAHTHW